MDHREAKAYDRGVNARKRGKTLDDNPYHHATSIQSKNFWAWKKGYEGVTENIEETA